MKRNVYIAGIVCIVLVLMIYYAENITFASSCCGTKEATAEQTETKCVVCGKVVDKGKAVKIEHEGKTVNLCCKHCAAEYKKDPCKYCKGDEKHEHHHHGEHH